MSVNQSVSRFSTSAYKPFYTYRRVLPPLDHGTLISSFPFLLQRWSRRCQPSISIASTPLPARHEQLDEVHRFPPHDGLALQSAGRRTGVGHVHRASCTRLCCMLHVLTEHKTG